MRREILGWLVVGWCLATVVSRATTPPRVRASIWLDATGEGRLGGCVYRLTDPKGQPYRLKEKVVLLILDTRP